jgi:hypothetical protein
MNSSRARAGASQDADDARGTDRGHDSGYWVLGALIDTTRVRIDDEAPATLGRRGRPEDVAAAVLGAVSRKVPVSGVDAVRFSGDVECATDSGSRSARRP